MTILYYAAGCIFGVLNFFLLHFTWNQILQKKNLVFPLSVIVIKYSIFILIIGAMISHPEKIGSRDENIAFLVGLISALALVTIFNKKLFGFFEKVAKR